LKTQCIKSSISASNWRWTEQFSPHLKLPYLLSSAFSSSSSPLAQIYPFYISTMKCVLVALTGLLSLTSALVAPRAETAIAATDHLLFSTTISAFEAARNAKNPPSLDWASDGCSSSPDNPFGFDFIEECHRHDFGYRNCKYMHFPGDLASF
jgi:hypothetical protein